MNEQRMRFGRLVRNLRLWDRPKHYRIGMSEVTECGVSIFKDIVTYDIKRLVTCKNCLKTIRGLTR